MSWTFHEIGCDRLGGVLPTEERGRGTRWAKGGQECQVVFGIWWPPQKLIFIEPTTKTYFYCANHKNLSKDHHWDFCLMIISLSSLWYIWSWWPSYTKQKVPVPSAGTFRNSVWWVVSCTEVSCSIMIITIIIKLFEARSVWHIPAGRTYRIRRHILPQ